MFHISQLKKHIGSSATKSQLPLIDGSRVLAKEPISITDRRINKKKGKAVTKVLVQWCNTFPEDATWEVFAIFMQQFPDFYH